MAGEKSKRGWSIRDTAAALFAVLLVGGLLSLTVLYKTYRIPSASMVPTLLVGEYVAAPNGSAQSLRPGDVVFYTEIDRMTGRPTSFVRRVLALPGQRIAFRNGVPIINGVTVRQEETNEAGPEGERIMRENLGGHSYRVAYQNDPASDIRDMSERVVPAGRVFLAGDARDNALDSRVNGPERISDIKQVGGWIIFSPVGGRAGHRIE